jgi:hypothetical protein
MTWWEEFELDLAFWLVELGAWLAKRATREEER